MHSFPPKDISGTLISSMLWLFHRNLRIFFIQPKHENGEGAEKIPPYQEVISVISIHILLARTCYLATHTWSQGGILLLTASLKHYYKLMEQHEFSVNSWLFHSKKVIIVIGVSLEIANTVFGNSLLLPLLWLFFFAVWQGCVDHWYIYIFLIKNRPFHFLSY